MEKWADMKAKAPANAEAQGLGAATENGVSKARAALCWGHAEDTQLSLIHI